MNQTINIPGDVHILINTLNLAGFEAYAVGGCVRDSLMGRTPKDWDVNTSATPEEVKKLFPKTFDTGIRHGTVSVRLNKVSYEVTTYRIDGRYSDGRRPDQVEYTASLKEDLLRRDFTMNAMAYHPKRGLVDFYGGVEDLKCGVIRCVGTPAARFSEDALRMLRAFRFAAQLGFTIEPVTERAIAMLCERIRYVSWERIADEFTKILVSEHPETIAQIASSGLMHYILPEWEACEKTEQHHPYHIDNVAGHTIRALKAIRSDRVLRWTMLLHDMAKPEVRQRDSSGTDHFPGHAERGEELAGRILRRFKFDNVSRERIERLVRIHDETPPEEETALRFMLRDIGAENYTDFLEVRRADILAQNPAYIEEGLRGVEASGRLYKRILERGDCVGLDGLKINGKDLMDLGFAPGRSLGLVLKSLLEAVIRDPRRNRRELLLETARRLYGDPEIRKRME